MTAKDLIIQPIPYDIANSIIEKIHYSGKYVRNSQLHLGVFWKGELHGAMQFGPSLDKRKLKNLVKNTGWNEFIELNRMAFSEELPRNSESRAIAIAMRMIKKHAPHIKWVISFADAAQCGDGAIYRASGFVLTAIKKTSNLAKLPDGTTMHKMTLENNPTMSRPELGGLSYYDVTDGNYDFNQYILATGAVPVTGYNLRYIYFIDKSARSQLTVDEIPFSQIDAVGARMYRGKSK
jgi:hypothetical protein